VLGACPNHPGVFYNFGHQHLGLTWAACSADLLLASIQQTIPAIALKPYRINRF
jgi:D-amino-acid dehydrogenase